ncbi:MAG: hypothetical protein HC880_10565, partial [Bacteroidia bacterium]|nr:hypothetical protein [Bacteroidia bacterium]
MFERGSLFRGSLNIVISGSEGYPLTFGAYGEGPEPIIKGTTPLSGWRNVASNIWEAECPACSDELNNLFVNGIRQPLGRYPNAGAPNEGYLSIDKTALDTLWDADIQGNWKRAEVVARTTRYTLNRFTVVAQENSALVLSLTGGKHNQLKEQYGYFFQNHPRCLDREGEWCYIPSTKKIRIFTRNAEILDKIEVTTSPYLIRIFEKEFIHFENLNLEAANENIITANRAQHLSFKGLKFYNAGTHAFEIHGSQH